MNSQNDAFDSLVDLMNRLIDEADDQMYILLNSDKVGDVIITMPSLLITYFKQAVAYRHNTLAPALLGKFFIFRGVQLIPSHDWAITLYHKDYSIYKLPWMIRRIPLDHPQEIKKEWYTEYILQLGNLISIKRDDSKLN